MIDGSIALKGHELGRICQNCFRMPAIRLVLANNVQLCLKCDQLLGNTLEAIKKWPTLPTVYTLENVTLAIKKTAQDDKQATYWFMVIYKTVVIDDSTNPAKLRPGSEVVLCECDDLIDVPNQQLLFVATLAIDHMVEKNHQLRQLIARLPQMCMQYMWIYAFNKED